MFDRGFHDVKKCVQVLQVIRIDEDLLAAHLQEHLDVSGLRRCVALVVADEELEPRRGAQPLNDEAHDSGHERSGADREANGAQGLNRCHLRREVEARRATEHHEQQTSRDDSIHEVDTRRAPRLQPSLERVAHHNDRGHDADLRSGIIAHDGGDQAEHQAPEHEGGGVVVGFGLKTEKEETEALQHPAPVVRVDDEGRVLPCGPHHKHDEGQQDDDESGNRDPDSLAVQVIGPTQDGWIAEHRARGIVGVVVADEGQHTTRSDRDEKRRIHGAQRIGILGQRVDWAGRDPPFHQDDDADEACHERSDQLPGDVHAQ
mmetsp:Transcript_92833/g.267017  ORF Transcript_92833/g.267017 Transcript_92833/m.267017 type:complete len:317 (-) Transcript_92833:2891-3841(-)